MKNNANAHCPVVTKGHKGSHSITKSHQAQTPAHPGGHKRATKSHQAQTPAYPGGHKGSQNRTRPKRQRIQGVTKGPQNRTRPRRWHQAQTPAPPGGHKGSQNRTRPKSHHIRADTKGHKSHQASQAVQLNCPAAVVDVDPAVQCANPFPNIFSFTEEDSKGKKNGNGNFHFSAFHVVLRTPWRGNAQAHAHASVRKQRQTNRQTTRGANTHNPPLQDTPWA